MKKKNRKEELKELTFLGSILAIFLLVSGLFFNSIFGLFFLIAHAAIGFVGYVLFEHYFSLGIVGVFITPAVSIYIHIWLDGGFDKEEKVKSEEDIK